MPKVFNKRTDTIPSGAVYVGRPTKWGNPFPMVRASDRDERSHVLIAYENWLCLERPDLLIAAKRELRGKDLVCWCSPEACHADILMKIANR